jgi:hypothetical protein
MKEVSLAKALKIKNRLSGELSRIKSIALRENSKNEKQFKEDVAIQAFEQVSELHDQLIEVKRAIYEANSGIAREMASLAEAKSLIDFVRVIPTKQGEYEESFNYRDETKPVNYSCYKTQEQVDSWVKSIQEYIDDIQDTIDEYNAKTKVQIDI